MEFFALMRWLLERARTAADRPYPDMIVLGDMNLDLDRPAEDRPAIAQALGAMSTVAAQSARAAQLHFPFLGAHPDRSEVFRTNARRTETFDQIAIIRRDARLPGPEANATAGTVPDGFDYGVFDFVDLISNALERRPFANLSTRARRRLLARFEHDLTDHMPIWVRLPRPSLDEVPASQSDLSPVARRLPSGPRPPFLSCLRRQEPR